MNREKCIKELNKIKENYYIPHLGQYPIPYDVEKKIRRKYGVNLSDRLETKCPTCGGLHFKQE